MCVHLLVVDVVYIRRFICFLQCPFLFDICVCECCVAFLRAVLRSTPPAMVMPSQVRTYSSSLFELRGKFEFEFVSVEREKMQAWMDGNTRPRVRNTFGKMSSGGREGMRQAEDEHYQRNE